MNTPDDRRKPWWSAVIMSAGAFVLVSLAYLAAGFGDRASPVNQFLNRHGGALILILAGLTIASGLLAMYLDQRQATPNRTESSDDDDGNRP